MVLRVLTKVFLKKKEREDEVEKEEEEGEEKGDDDLGEEGIVWLSDDCKRIENWE